MTTDKLSMRNNMEDKHMTKYWPDSLSPQWSHETVITVSRSTWMTTKINGVAIDLFCTGVIGDPRYMFSN